jgi:hypothetical protein
MRIHVTVYKVKQLTTSRANVFSKIGTKISTVIGRKEKLIARVSSAV